MWYLGAMRWPTILKMFDQVQQHYVDAGHTRCERAVLVERAFPVKKARDCAIALVDDDPPVICFHPDVYPRLDVNQCLALLCHELAHVADPSLGEAATDALAEQVTGIAIYYGADDIQTTAGGVRPRPRRLPR